MKHSWFYGHVSRKGDSYKWDMTEMTASAGDALNLAIILAADLNVSRGHSYEWDIRAIEVTENEALALHSSLNYADMKTQLEDNYSVGCPELFAEKLGWNAQQVGGLITSMTEKGLGIMDEEGCDIFWLTELGVRVAFAWAEKVFSR